MSLMTIPWTLSKRLWARARARGEPSYFIVFSKNARCSSVRGCTYLTIGTSSWGVQSKAKVYIVLDMGRYYTKKLLGGRLCKDFCLDMLILMRFSGCGARCLTRDHHSTVRPDKDRGWPNENRKNVDCYFRAKRRRGNL